MPSVPSVIPTNSKVVLSDATENDSDDNGDRFATNQSVNHIPFSDCDASSIVESSVTGNSLREDISYDLIGSIESIAIENSSNISVGNKTFVNAPVVIKRFVSDNDILKDNQHSNIREEPAKAVRTSSYLAGSNTLLHKGITVALTVALILSVITILILYTNRQSMLADTSSCYEDNSECHPDLVQSACSRCITMWPGKTLCKGWCEFNGTNFLIRCQCLNNRNECSSDECKA